MSGGALEADEPSDERVVPRVRRVAVALPKNVVEPVFGHRKRMLHAIAEATETRGSYRDQQRLDRLDSQMEV
jgi:hypothetical protein